MPEVAASIQALSGRFSGRLLVAADPDWDTARRVHNGFVDRRPAVVAQCRGSADIVEAIRLAREHDLPIAVRGGGHNVSGRATVDGGVMIDLSPMKYVAVDPSARTAHAAGGTLWGQFNLETQLHGLATTGGVVSSTGVAGLTLGGGLGWLMPKHGMALDNLLGAEIVLADGRVVRASARENEDLYWGIRGGGGNFGVASSLQFALHPVGPIITGGLIAWPAARAREVMRHFRALAAEATDDVMLVCALITGPDAVTKLAAIGLGCIGEGEGARWTGALRRLGEPALDGLGPIPYAQLNSLLDGSYPAGARNYWKSHFLPALVDDAIDVIVDRFLACPSPMGQVVLEHFHGAATRVEPTATAYALRASGFNLLLLSQWADARDDAAGIEWARSAFGALQAYTGAVRYANYMDHDDVGDSALAATYGPNVRRLRELKAKYDPDNVFRLNLNIPPA